MERVPYIDIKQKKHSRHKLIWVLTALLTFSAILLASHHYIVKKNILENLNPISQMQKYYKAKKYSKVIEKGEYLLKKHPNSLIIRRYLWKSYLYTKQYSKTLQTIKGIEAISPDKMEVTLAYCTSFRIMGEYEKMNYYCNRALEIRKNSQIAHEQIVQSFIEQKKYDEAISYLNQISEKLNDSLRSTIIRANIATLKGNYKESIKLLDKLRKEYPDAVIIYYYLGDNYFNLEDYATATSYFEEFTNSVYNKDVDVEILQNAYTNLALSYEKAKMYSNAYRAYKSAACFTMKLRKTNETVRLMTKAIASTYAGQSDFVSESDFRMKFGKLEKELEKRCGEKLFH